VGALLASDVQPLLEYTKEVYYIEHDEMVIARDGGLEFFDISGGAAHLKAVNAGDLEC
jgi:glucosamine 6-phosphate synthetase-like amidotransferase/phosphosugar isomerase protein